jgi:formylglycine-generating enzyme required for sulfatase activity
LKSILIAMLFVGAAVFAGDDPKKDFVEIPANPGFAFARDLQSRGPRGNAGEKSPITKTYRLAKYPVTNAEYADFCAATKHRTPRYWRDGKFPKGKDRHPVLEVSVDDVEAYCRYLEKKHPGWRFRLPTEAEWENAAAGPEHFAFPWGNSDQVRMKNGLIVAPFSFNAVVASYYLAKSPELKVTFLHRKSSRQGESVTLRELISVNDRGQVRGWINHADYTGFVYTDLFRKLADAGGVTTAVDRYPEGKSHYGCFDMAGNSWDWTSSEITATNGAERGKTVNAIRGGSWYANKNSCRADFRGEGRRARGCYNTVGFRLVAEPK